MDKINKIYRFLEDNRSYAYKVQNGVYESWLSYYILSYDRAYACFHHAFNTQSQPKLDKGFEFFKGLNKTNLKSLKAFVSNFGLSKELTYENLFYSLSNQPGWGNKTAALFTKNIYQIHTDPKLKRLRFWKDLPLNIDNDKMFVPVDEVIKFIFQFINPLSKNFKQINTLLLNRGYSFQQMEIWDDLWYWGFITQHGSKDRYFEFNEAKYWSLLFSDKNEKIIKEVRKKSQIFIAILKS